MKPKVKKPERLRIVVGTNSLTETQYPAYTNHCQFWFRLGRSYPHIEFIFSNPSRMSIDRMRNMSARVALDTKSDYLLFLDDDVIVNPNYGLQQLLDCNADIAAGKINIRGYPFDYMSFTQVKNKGLIADSKLPKKGIVNKDAIGFSFALIKTSMLKKLQEPYFMTGLNHTEDIYFCLKAKQVDPQCTIKVNCECECGHILWPEIMHEANRESYVKYFMQANNIKKAGENSGGDRGRNYLTKVKKVLISDKKAESRLRVQ